MRVIIQYLLKAQAAGPDEDADLAICREQVPYYSKGNQVRFEHSTGLPYPILPYNSMGPYPIL